MAPSTLAQFTRFGTDASGIERILRMFQAMIMVVSYQPTVDHNIGMLVALGNEHNIWREPWDFDTVNLRDMRERVALARRFLRMFRFLDCFQTAHEQYVSLYSQQPTPPPATLSPLGPPNPTKEGAEQQKEHPSPTNQPSKPPGTPTPTSTTTKAQHQHPPPEAWLDLIARTFNGMYLLLETLTLADTFGIPILGHPWATVLHVEGQRFWFLALALGVASGLAKMVRLFACAPVTATTPPPEGRARYGTGEEYWRAEGAMADWERERERLWRENVRGRWRGLARRCVADFLDLAAPGNVVGWLRIDRGTVAVIQLITTYLTGLDVWERCGREVAKI